MNVEAKLPMSNATKIFEIIFSWVAIAMSCYHLYAVVNPVLSSVQNSNIHLGFAMVLLYLCAIIKGKYNILKCIDFLCIAGIIICAVYIQINYLRLITKVGLVTSVDKVVGLILLILVIDASRRTFGLALPLITICTLLYLRYGQIFPGFFKHAGFSWVRIVATMTTNFTGIYGTILDISATYIIIFMIFGGFLNSSGTGQFFIKLALAIGGRLRSGPAQAAVLSSCLVGSINGSAVSNVATTGVFTIPLMKRCGYSSEMSGALESVASTGGMIMPPIMGVGAFVMSGITGIPYVHIALAALIPGILYFVTAGFTAHVYAVKHGFKAMEKSEIPDLRTTLKEGGHFILPMVVVIFSMTTGISVMKSGFYGIVSVFVVVIVRNSLKNWRYVFSPEFRKFIKDGLISGAKSAMMIAPACAVMGILSQAIVMSGLAFKIVFFIKNISGGYQLFALVLTMLISLFFGMGIPTTASYALVAIIGASALTELGFSLLSVHMFIYYYAILANITPPVCAAVLVGSQIAQANYMKTALMAVRIGLPGFFLPFLFMYNPELLMQGSVISIIIAFLTALLGMFVMVTVFEGFMIKKLSAVQRLLATCTCIALIVPGLLTDIVGLVLLGLLIFWQKKQIKQISAMS